MNFAINSEVKLIDFRATELEVVFIACMPIGNGSSSSNISLHNILKKKSLIMSTETEWSDVNLAGNCFETYLSTYLRIG